MTRGPGREVGLVGPVTGLSAPLHLGSYACPSQAVLSRMVDKDDLRKRFDLVLRESAAVREASKELTREVERLRAQIEKHQAKERRKKPRVQGK